MGQRDRVACSYTTSSVLPLTLSGFLTAEKVAGISSEERVVFHPLPPAAARPPLLFSRVFIAVDRLLIH